MKKYLAAVVVVVALAGCAPAPQETTQETTETVSQAPQACLDALDYADQGFELASRGFYASEKAMGGLIDNDLAAMTEANEELSQINQEMEGLDVKYREAKEACRSAG